ncbi:hypothetical protein HYFRA_00012734 [Hymenoscyphus fraxineus]|uniref:Uncharacterized protein n=1 Tax=Hymenoscyphus fraxineus TaxID=746836 RepID=A0A9N9PUF9_9HELO|nr:hypothetical protein HYFRA_00012734 [Hymenoscyphus fraxineus]
MPGTGPTLHYEVKLSWVLSTNEILGLSGQGASGADEESGTHGEDDGIISICKQPPALAVRSYYTWCKKKCLYRNMKGVMDGLDLDFGRKENMENWQVDAHKTTTRTGRFRECRLLSGAHQSRGQPRAKLAAPHGSFETSKGGSIGLLSFICIVPFSDFGRTTP